jgi:hypothetical protein
LLSCEACQRFAAFRVRNRIFDVFRFGTPMAGAYQSITTQENNNRSVIPSEVEMERPGKLRHRREGQRVSESNPVGLQTVTLRDASTPLRSAQDDSLRLTA